MNKIYYFTGTGNSLQIAEDLSGELGESSINKIAEYSGDLIEADTLGIIFPIYFWGLPLIVCEFLKKLNVKRILIFMPLEILADFPVRHWINVKRFCMKEN